MQCFRKTFQETESTSIWLNFVMTSNLISLYKKGSKDMSEGSYLTAGSQRMTGVS